MNMFTKRLKNKKGFTLVELIVVLAILVIISGLAAPKFMGVQEGARKTADVTNAATIANAVNVQMVGEKFIVGTDGLEFKVTKVTTVPVGSGEDVKAQKALTDYMQTLPLIKSNTRGMSGKEFYIVISNTSEVSVYDAVSTDTKRQMLYPTPGEAYK